MCLKKLNYDRKELERRREQSQHEMRGKYIQDTSSLRVRIFAKAENFLHDLSLLSSCMKTDNCISVTVPLKHKMNFRFVWTVCEILLYQTNI